MSNYRHVAQSAVGYAPSMPSMDFIPGAERSLQQAVVMSATQATSGEELELEGNHATLVALFMTPGKLASRPEVAAVRKDKPFSAQASVAGAGMTTFRDLGSYFARDYQTLAVAAATGEQPVRLGLALPYAIAAQGNVSILDTRLERFYQAINSNGRISMSLAATLAEDALNDIAELGKRLESRARSLEFPALRISQIGEDTEIVSGKVLLRAMDKVFVANLLLSSGTTPAQSLAQLANQPKSYATRVTMAGKQIGMIPIERIKDQKAWLTSLLGESAYALGRSAQNIRANDPVDLRSAWSDLAAEMRMPMRPSEGFVQGYVYLENGARARTRDLLGMLESPESEQFFARPTAVESEQDVGIHVFRSSADIEGKKAVAETGDLFGASTRVDLVEAPVSAPEPEPVHEIGFQMSMIP